jgi:hypothetical protein
MAIKVTGTTVINDSRNIENITTINGTAWATVVANASAGSEVTVNDLTDVTLGTLTTGEVLQYNGSAWVNTGLDFTDIASTLANAQVVASNVTQHQAALSITESQISDLGTYETADSTILKDADIGVNVQAFGSYETADSTILKDADIGVNVEAYDATILKDADIGVNVEAYDATIVKDADIGVNVQAYDANLVSDANYVATDENFTTADHSKLDGIEAGATADQTKADVEGLGIAFSSLSVKPTTIAGYGITDASTTTEMNSAISTAIGNLVDTAPAALDTLNEIAASLNDDADFAGTMTTALASKEPADATILKDADIGVNVLAYDANVVSDANYVATDENFTTADHSKLDGIEASATADQTDAEIRAAVEAATDSNVFTDADHSKLDAIEALADVTDVTNVTAAGALMDSEVTNLADVKAFDPADYQAAGSYEPADSTILKDADIGVNVLAYDANVVSDANYVATANDFTTVLKDKLDAIEASADVTDTTNVTSAGALMDSEVTNLAQVKAFDSADYATAAQGAKADTALQSYTVTEGDVTGHQAALSITESQISDLGTYETADSTILKDADIGVNVQAYDANIVSDATYVATDENFTTADHAKLDGIETGATADQTKADIDALNIDADTLDGQQGSYYTGYVDTAISNLIDSAPGALDTLNELAASLGDDDDFAGSMTTALAGKASSAHTHTFASLTSKPTTVSGYGITDLATVATSGSAGDLSTGFIPNARVGLLAVSQHEASLSIAWSQVTSTPTTLAGYGITDSYDGSFSSLSGKPTTISGYGITDAFDGAYASLSGVPSTFAPSAHTIESHSDVTISSIASGEVLKWNGSAWINNTLAEAGIQAAGSYASGSHTHTFASLTSKPTTISGYGITDAFSGNYNDLSNKPTHDNYNYWTISDGSSSEGIGSTETVTIAGGNAVGTSYNTSTNTLTINHDDTSSQGSVNNSGRTYIQDITLDTYGHITGITSATETVTNSDTTYSAGSGLDISGTTFSVEADLRDGITHVGRDSNDYIAINTTTIDFVLDGSTRARVENDGDFHADGDLVGYSTTISDERLKHDINKVDNALDKICQLSGYTFTYNKDNVESAGVIAQEVEKVLPSAVKEKSGGFHGEGTYKTVQYDQLTALLIESIKELKLEIETLKTR